MKETIIKFQRGPFPKKYTAFVRNKKTHKIRRINFGDRRYQQYKDRTPLHLYSKLNHLTRKDKKIIFLDILELKNVALLSKKKLEKVMVIIILKY